MIEREIIGASIDVLCHLPHIGVSNLAMRKGDYLSNLTAVRYSVGDLANRLIHLDWHELTRGGAFAKPTTSLMPFILRSALRPLTFDGDGSFLSLDSQLIRLMTMAAGGTDMAKTSAMQVSAVRMSEKDYESLKRETEAYAKDLVHQLEKGSMIEIDPFPGCVISNIFPMSDTESTALALCVSRKGASDAGESGDGWGWGSAADNPIVKTRELYKGVAIDTDKSTLAAITKQVDAFYSPYVAVIELGEAHRIIGIYSNDTPEFIIKRAGRVYQAGLEAGRIFSSGVFGDGVPVEDADGVGPYSGQGPKNWVN